MLCPYCEANELKPGRKTCGWKRCQKLHKRVLIKRNWAEKEEYYRRKEVKPIKVMNKTGAAWPTQSLVSTPEQNSSTLQQ